MNSPLLWIAIPAFLSIILFFLRGRVITVSIIGIGIATLLAVVAWYIPFEEIYAIGSFEFNITASYTLLGRRFVLDAAKSTVLVLLYGGVAFWFVGGTSR